MPALMAMPSPQEKFEVSWAITATLVAIASIWKLLRVLGNERECPSHRATDADVSQLPERPPGHHYHPQLHQMLDAQHRRKEERIQYKATGLKTLQRSRGRIMFPLPAREAIDLDLDYARKHHKATRGLPGRRDTFKPKFGPNVYSGLDVRKAAFQFHLATGRRRPKEFLNTIFAPDHLTHPSELPVPHLFNTTTGTSNAVREFPVASGGPGYLVDNQKGEARILLSAGPHFEAVIAHNPTLPIRNPNGTTTICTQKNQSA